MTLRRFIPIVAILLLNALALVSPAGAHPMGNFSINHYARFTADKDRLALLFVLDMAEIPTVTERKQMDADGDGKISNAERNAYVQMKIQQLRSNLLLLVNENKAAVSQSQESLEFQPGAGGLETLRLAFTLNTKLPNAAKGWRVVYQDSNYTERTGWKEIIATAREGTTILQSTAGVTDITRELTIYPTDPTIAVPQQTEAEFTICIGGMVSNLALNTQSQSGRLAAVSTIAAPSSAAARTPQDGFTQSISRHELTPGVILLSLGLALLFGAFHALSPGHGKAMVAAYLVGSRGTIRHAVFLGAVITLTHTVSVFVLGVVTLIAEQYIVPERLYPLLSLVSGLAIVCVGATLGWQRIARLQAERCEMEENEEFWEGNTDQSTESPLPPNVTVSLRSLIVLGITGGALPCPSALVVMLGAIALHRIAFGLALIGAFSLGLASVLTGIGVLVVRVRHVLERLPLYDRITSRLPILSAVLVTVVGLVLIIRALHGQF